MIKISDQDYKWIKSIPADSLKFIRGIEKEGLRVTPEGKISQLTHPKALGSALTHPMITTDYSEALLEFITPAKASTDDLVTCLQELHQFTYQNIAENELIWPGSMPAIIDDELDIHIAEYGSSNIGRLKHIYRHGLWHRYGRIMQSIAGLHFNFSMPESFWQHYYEQQNSTLPLNEFQSASYFRMIRNFRRHSWLLMYLFGASPAIDNSFIDADNSLKPTGKHTKYLPYGSSIRMSDVGYTNKAQDVLNVSFDGLDEYISSLRKAIHQVHEPYQALGQKKNGEYMQINSNILQIENEYYSDVRPKRVTGSGEKPVCALKIRGVEYVEIRCMDLDPFEPLGISKDSIHFLEIFLTWCLLESEQTISIDEANQLKSNLKTVVHDGLRPDLQLFDQGEKKPIQQMIKERLDSIGQLANTVDQVRSTNTFASAVAAAQHKADNPETIASNKLRKRLEQGEDYTDIMLDLAKQHQKTFNKVPLSAERYAQLEALAIKSHQEQAELEAADEIPFDTFIEDYQHQDDKYCG